MTRLASSVAVVSELLKGDLAAEQNVERLLTETYARRALDLSDLGPAEQAELIAGRAVEVLPSKEALRDAIAAARAEGRKLVVKLGIDPTSSDVHLGHAVSMVVLSRFQRMGHQAILIIGDITAKIGDPSGRSSDRPPLTDADIARNLATYQDQVSPFFDFTRAKLRHNSEWLSGLTLPELIEILAQIPVSMSLQREDFRARLAEGRGVAMSEFIYSVVMAIDSVRIESDVELGGIDQLLNMQMGRKVMEVCGQRPQFVVAMPLIEGTDGTGKKMSKSLDNYVALGAKPDDVFGKVMSIPDRLVVPYLKAWTEWSDAEIAIVEQRVAQRSLHPMHLKRILAAEAVAALHGVSVALAALQTFASQFSRRTFSALADLPVVDLGQIGDETVGGVLATALGFTASVSAARKMAGQRGLRLVVETTGDGGGQAATVLTEESVFRPLREVVAEVLAEREARAETAGGQPDGVYLKAGRKLAKIVG